ncbi:Ig-like domain-containing protein [Salmonella enterica]|nr:Ig-like domain-containing protein [Salmonella enterica]EJF5595133.1 Ig-like domain-containing protein [Salmonella enterica]EJF5826262.1 Ig-like domain-containing protein [Salmonella enterica]EJF5844914.1 Ig-like domain-containing protein [Salmonella enterica]EJF5917411.1 Ig-like domain-containing protein [Salmonella enterica]
MKDKNGQPVQQDPDRTAFFIDGGDRGAVDISRPQADPARPGVLTATASSQTALDAVNVGLKINGKDTGKRVTLSFTPDLTSLVPALTADKNNVVVDGQTPVILTVTTRDRFGNPVGAQAVTLSTADNTAVLKDTLVTTDATGKAQTTLTATTPGEKTVTAEVNGQQATAKVWFVADAATAKVDSLTADVTQQTVGDGNDRVIVLTAMVTDGLNNPVTGAKVDWLQDGGDGYSLSAATTTTDDQGKTTVVMTAPAHRAGSNITVSAQTGDGAAQTTKVSWLADAARAAVTATTLDDPSVTEHKADGLESFAWTAQVSDPYGNPVINAPVKWTSSVGAVTLSAAETKTDANGDARVTAYSTVAAGDVVVSAQAVSGAAVPSTPVSFVADEANGRIVVTVTKDDAVADNNDVATLHVRLADPAGAGIPSRTLKVDLSASPDVVTADGSTTYTMDAKGELDLHFKTTRAGTHELTLTADIPTAATPPTVVESLTFVAGPLDAANSEVIVPVSAAAEGGTLRVQVYPRDQYNNAIPLTAVKDQLKVTPSAAGVTLNTTWTQGTEAAGNSVIIGTMMPTKDSFGMPIRRNSIDVFVGGTKIGTTEKAAWAPALRASEYTDANVYTTTELAEISRVNEDVVFVDYGNAGARLAGWLGSPAVRQTIVGTDPVSGADVLLLFDGVYSARAMHTVKVGPPSTYTPVCFAQGPTFNAGAGSQTGGIACTTDSDTHVTANLMKAAAEAGDKALAIGTGQLGLIRSGHPSIEYGVCEGSPVDLGNCESTTVTGQYTTQSGTSRYMDEYDFGIARIEAKFPYAVEDGTKEVTVHGDGDAVATADHIIAYSFRAFGGGAGGATVSWLPVSAVRQAAAPKCGPASSEVRGAFAEPVPFVLCRVQIATARPGGKKSRHTTPIIRSRY